MRIIYLPLDLVDLAKYQQLEGYIDVKGLKFKMNEGLIFYLIKFILVMLITSFDFIVLLKLKLSNSNTLLIYN